jgi:hypothetical protein
VKTEAVELIGERAGQLEKGCGGRWRNGCCHGI